MFTNGILGIAKIRQNDFGPLIKSLTTGRDRYLARCAVQQLNPKIIFKGGHRPIDLGT